MKLAKVPNMTRFSFRLCFALAIALASGTRADVTYTEGKDKDETAIRMTVSPAPEPAPALRYRFVARGIDLKPGNSAPYYYRAQLNLNQTMKHIREKFNEDKELGRWYDTGVESRPIGALPVDKVRKAAEMFDPTFNGYLKPAFERSDCDWQLGVEQMRGPDIVSFLLPEFQDSREIARMLVLRTRLAIAERRYSDAVESMQQQYRLGSDVAKGPFLVCGLIGVAIDGMTNGTVVDFIANPDSPNLYWALAQLPKPPIDLQRSASLDMDFGPRMFPFIVRPETTVHSTQEWSQLLAQAILDFGKTGVGFSPHDSREAGLTATGIALLGYTHAKERLIAQGMNRDRVEKMSVGQVIAIYTERNYRSFADDLEKLSYIPFADMGKAADAGEKRLAAAQAFGNGEDREILPIVSLLLPAMQSARIAEVKLEREVALLRVIEALRMYAATHGGGLPARLDEIDQVPVPKNPATGKPFVYRLDGATAILELPLSDGLRDGKRRYEIQIAAKK
jgi:hypothetical protein